MSRKAPNPPPSGDYKRPKVITPPPKIPSSVAEANSDEISCFCGVNILLNKIKEEIMTENVSALEIQQDGNHYKTMKMQPIELGYRLNATPCFVKLCKYSSRIKVDRLGDLKKAKHCIQLEKEIVEKFGNPYAALRLDYANALALISQFTDNDYIKAALHFMYSGRYDYAIDYVNILIEGFEKNGVVPVKFEDEMND